MKKIWIVVVLVSFLLILLSGVIEVYWCKGSNIMVVTCFSGLKTFGKIIFILTEKIVQPG